MVMTQPLTSTIPRHSEELEKSMVDFYPTLLIFVRKLVYSSSLAIWRGQEEAIAQDIVQQTMQRIIERSHKSDRGEAKPITSTRHMMVTIAANYCRDLRRRERRLIHLDNLTFSGAEAAIPQVRGEMNWSDEAIENVFNEDLFRFLVHEIVRFPDKQRHALLVDLASYMNFTDPPTLLQQAFLQVGISLSDYKCEQEKNKLERGRHSALCRHAYRRLYELYATRERCLEAQYTLLS